MGKRDGDESALVFVPAALVHLVLGLPDTDPEGTPSVENCIIHMRDLVAVRHWRGVLAFYLVVMDEFTSWQFMQVHGLTAAMIWLGESPELTDILENAQREEDSEFVFYSAATAALEYVDPKVIENRYQLRTLIHGKYREVWIIALMDKREYKAILRTLEGVSGDDMTLHERRGYCHSLSATKRYQEAVTFLERWPDDATTYNMARRHGGAEAFAELYSKLLDSADAKLKRRIKDDYTILGIAFWGMFKAENELTGWDKVKYTLGFLLLILLSPLYLLRFLLRLLFRYLRWGWRFILVRVY